jgi:hypothetical protein
MSVLAKFACITLSRMNHSEWKYTIRWHLCWLVCCRDLRNRKCEPWRKSSPSTFAPSPGRKIDSFGATVSTQPQAPDPTENIWVLDKQTDQALTERWTSEVPCIHYIHIQRCLNEWMNHLIGKKWHSHLEVKTRVATNSCWGHRGSKVEFISRNTLDALVSGYDLFLPCAMLGFVTGSR